MCIDSITRPHCICPTGKLYREDKHTCGIDDLCHKKRPCKNDGICIPSPGGYKCQCPFGWKGKNCTERVNPCDGENIKIRALQLNYSQMVRIRVKMEAIVYLLIMSTISSVSVDLRTTRVNIVSCSMIDPLMSALAMILPLAKMSQMIKPVKRSRFVLNALSSISLFELKT